MDQGAGPSPTVSEHAKDHQADPPPHVAEAAAALFGDRLPIAIRFAELLIGEGVQRGLIGPREAPRIWERHLLNCAAIGELIPHDARVTDVGSGAGLPGIVLSVARPDLTVTLVEPLARRTTFLSEVVTTLALTRTTVVRSRAEEFGASPAFMTGSLGADVVTARAVAPLDRLAAWCLPLATKGGRVLAIKGDSASEEVEAFGVAIEKLGGGEPTLRLCGVDLLDTPTTVVEFARERVVSVRDRAARSRSRTRPPRR